VKQQQALPLKEVLRRARRMNGNDRKVVIGQLIVVAFFFAMRSCKYSNVQGKRMTVLGGRQDRGRGRPGGDETGRRGIGDFQATEESG
jgi:hypothetical protein